MTLRSLRSGIASLLLALYLAGCSTWHIGTPTPASFVEKEHPNQVRVTRVDGSTLDLEDPVIRGDSLVGTTGSGVPPFVSRQEVAIALSEVQSVAVRRTSMLITSLVAAGVVAIIIVGLCASEEDYSPC